MHHHQVTASEGVDRLLRIADQHHRRLAAEGPVDHLPLHGVAELFDEREQAALRLAEITTTLPDHDTAESEYARARKVLTDDELSAVIWVATAINAFNRVSILSRHPVRPQLGSGAWSALGKQVVTTGPRGCGLWA